jgi:cyclopropane fatty-acyl-phospholipid synthase-like methyltransferase
MVSRAFAGLIGDLDRIVGELPIAPAGLRNCNPILGVLLAELGARRELLEIGSGTGQHAVYFAARFPHLSWQTSDLDEAHDGIRAHIADAKQANVKPPLSLDVRSAKIESVAYDVVYTCNTAHIMGIAAVEKMIGMAGAVLKDDGLFLCYGPFRQNQSFITQSNEKFDAWLKQQDVEMGIRDLEQIYRLSATVGLHPHRLYAMPANNLFVVLKKDTRNES